MLGHDDSALVTSCLVSTPILNLLTCAHSHLQPLISLHVTSSIGIIHEGQVVMDKTQDLLQAMFILRVLMSMKLDE